MNIDKLYDLIWIKADRLIRQYKPCGIQNMYGLSLVCNNKQMVNKYGNNLCCGKCKWLDKEIGCTVKSVGCKVGTCWNDDSWDNIAHNDLKHINLPDTFIVQMDRLRNIAMRYSLYKIRMSKEETLKWRSLQCVNY